MTSENTAFCLALHFVGYDLSVFKAGNSPFFSILGFCMFPTCRCAPRRSSPSLVPFGKKLNVMYLGAGVLGGVALVHPACIYFFFGFYCGLPCSGRARGAPCCFWVKGNPLSLVRILGCVSDGSFLDAPI